MDKLKAAVDRLIQSARKSGSVTIAQINSVLPEGATQMDQIEYVMSSLEDAGIDISEKPAEDGGAKDAPSGKSSKRAASGRKKKASADDVFAADDDDEIGGDGDSDGSDSDNGSNNSSSSNDDEPSEAELLHAVSDITEKIDDPVRMYLTQMGEIPLLTRDEEISLARKIELTRKQFRKLVLVSGFGTASAIEHPARTSCAGELAFDRTMKVNQQDPDDRQVRT
jgi:RNA polymerase primary sigma factor